MAESRSFMVYPDGTVPFESLTSEERQAWASSVMDRIGKAISDYVKRHPEHYQVVRDALLSSGGTLIEETRIDRNGKEVEVTHDRA